MTPEPRMTYDEKRRRLDTLYSRYCPRPYYGDTIHPKIGRDEALAVLRELAALAHPDAESAHKIADTVLMALLADDREVLEAYLDIERWFA
jgi:hypothetical protein